MFAMNNLVGGVAAAIVDMDDHARDDGEAAVAAADAAAAAAVRVAEAPPLNVNTALAHQAQEDRLVGAILPARKVVATIRQLVFQPQDLKMYR